MKFLHSIDGVNYSLDFSREFFPICWKDDLYNLSPKTRYKNVHKQMEDSVRGVAVASGVMAAMRRRVASINPSDVQFFFLHRDQWL